MPSSATAWATDGSGVSAETIDAGRMSVATVWSDGRSRVVDPPGDVGQCHDADDPGLVGDGERLGS